MSLVVAAQKLILRIGQARTRVGLAHHQEQMSVLRLHIEHLDIGISISPDVEELAVPVVPHVDHDTARFRPHERADFGPGAQLVELGFDVDGIHALKDTGGVGWFAGPGGF